MINEPLSLNGSMTTLKSESESVRRNKTKNASKLEDFEGNLS